MATCDLIKPPRVIVKVVMLGMRMYLVWTWMLGDEENLGISRPYLMSL